MRDSTLASALIIAIAGGLAVAAAEKKAPATRPTSASAPAKPPTRPAEELVGKVVLKAMGKDFKAAMEKVPGGHIDWTQGRVIASGTAKAAGADKQSIAMARRGARLLAARNAVLLINGLRMGPGGKVPQIKEGTIKMNVVVKGLREISSKFDHRTMTVTAKVSIPIYGADGIVSITGVTVVAWRRRGFVWPLAKAGRDQADVVIIDARGTGFLPCLMPRVTDASGNTILSVTQLGLAKFKNRGVVVYISTTEAAAAQAAGTGPLALAKKVAAQAGRIDPKLVAAAKQAYTNPLLLQADKSPKDTHGTLVLTNTATRILMSRGEAKELLHAGRTVVVVSVPEPTKS